MYTPSYMFYGANSWAKAMKETHSNRLKSTKVQIGDFVQCLAIYSRGLLRTDQKSELLLREQGTRHTYYEWRCTPHRQLHDVCRDWGCCCRCGCHWSYCENQKGLTLQGFQELEGVEVREDDVISLLRERKSSCSVDANKQGIPEFSALRSFIWRLIRRSRVDY